MCGIAGAIGFVDAGVIEAVSRAHAALIHRGPDDAGRWHDVRDERGIALAHRRLAIIDLSTDGAQPMHDTSTGNVIVYNGEIYNFQSLRKELEERGHVFQTRTDTEVLLKAHAEWGDDAVERLDGMFAYALWHAKERRTLFVRDRMGIKPLYYTRSGSTFLFASEVRALLATGLVDRRLDQVALGTYLWNGFVVGPRTIIAGVELLPAGSMMNVFESGETGPVRQYWRHPASDGVSDDTTELSHSLQESVRMRLVADVPLGVFLSGGIDSSALAALASRMSDEPVQTFNISFDEIEFDESLHAKHVAESIQSDHHDIRLTERDFANQLDDALASIDQPTFDAINTYFVSRAVREAGLTVALAGTGGDELFGGYASFRELPRAMKWSRRTSKIPETWLRVGASMVARAKTGRPGEVKPQTRWAKFGDALATRGDVVKMYQVSYGLFTREFLGELSTASQQVVYGLPAERAQELETEVLRCEPLGAISRLEQALFLGERLLRDTDAASMAVSLEVRVPLLDHSIIEALASLREASRFAPVGKKRLLRELGLQGIEPSIFDRPKSGFVLPLELWCRRRLKDAIDSTFADAQLSTAIGLQPEAVGRLWRSYQAGSPGLYWSRIWSLFILLHWCRDHRVTL
jgi:asparagine synthase (glutamine-hydrolysing)